MSLVGAVDLGDLVYMISTFLFGTEEVASGVVRGITAGEQIVQRLLGDEGLMALTNIIQQQGGTGEVVTAIENLAEGEFNELKLFLEASWDDPELVTKFEDIPTKQVFTKMDYVNNGLIIAKNLAKNGIDMSLQKSKDLLIKMIKAGFQYIKDPKNIKNFLGAAAGAFAGDKIYQKFKAKAKAELIKKKKALQDKILNPDIGVEQGGYGAGGFSIE